MDENRRVFVAIGITLLIFFGWQWVMQKTHPQPPAEQATQGAPAAQPSAAPSAPAPQQPAAQPGAVTEEPAATAEAPARALPESQAPFATPLFRGEVTSRGALAQLLLRDYHEERGKETQHEPVSLVTANLAGTGDRQVLPTIVAGGKPIVLEFVERNPGRMVLTGMGEDGVRATLTISPRQKEYALDYDLAIENAGAAPAKTSVTVEMGLTPRPGTTEHSFFTPPADMVSGLCYSDDSVERYESKGLAKQAQTFPQAGWAGLDRQYFVVAVVPEGGGGQCHISAKDTTVLVDYALGGAELAPGKSWHKKYVVYAGPKRDGDLGAVAPTLKSVINYNIWKIPLGFLARPMVAVLNLFHGWTGSWGVAIILLTFLVKLILFPVTYKSSLSMRRMQLIKPEIDKLKERFGNDKERMQLEQMKLFREKGVNPLGGCLPMLLQMPVWFALYRMLWTSVDLYQQSFLWLDNLTAKEPFPYLAIAFGLLTVVQQKLQPTAMDSQQAKIMMYVMPVMFTVFMFGLPSGLVLYIVVNSILTIFQQLVINRRQVTV